MNLGSLIRVTSGFLLGSLFSWGAGQFMQDLLSPNCPRPAFNDPSLVAEFLHALPFVAHAGRLGMSGLGIVAGMVLGSRLPGGKRSDGLAIGGLFILGVLFDLARIRHGVVLSGITLTLSLASCGMGWRVITRSKA